MPAAASDQSTASPTSPLLDVGSEPNDSPNTMNKKTWLGNTVVKDDEDWSYVMSWTCVEPKDADVVMKDGMKILSSIFTPRFYDQWFAEDADLFRRLSKDEVTKKEFVNVIWNKVIELLTGETCGFSVGWKPTIDGKHFLLLIKLENQDTKEQLAKRLRYNMPLTKKAYKVKGFQCPTLPITLWQKIGWDKHDAVEVPAYLNYDSDQDREFKAQAKERIKLAKKLTSSWYDDGHEAGATAGDTKPTSPVGKALDAVGSALTGHKKDDPETLKAMYYYLKKKDMRKAIMIVLVEEMTLAEEKKDTAKAEKVGRLFDRCSQIIEADDADLRFSMDTMKDNVARRKARKEQWLSPHALTVEEYQNTDLFGKFTDLDVLRLIRRRIKDHMHAACLEKYGLIDAYNPVHHRGHIDGLSKSWASLSICNLLQWPGDEYNERVRDYFGEEVAFFFEWLAYITRCLTFPAAMSIVSITSPYWMDTHAHVRTLRCVYGFGLCFWCAYLVGSYTQAMKSYNSVWGISAMAQGELGTERQNYDPSMRGSFKEGFIRLAHWSIGFVLVGWTIYAAYAIGNFRSRALGTPDEVWRSPFGYDILYKDAQSYGKYAVTLNIKIVNLLWGVLSSQLAERENWRTQQEFKNRQVTKAFLVKCVVYYYPFIYLAFFRRWVEGADKVPTEEVTHTLRMNLTVFVITHLATVVVTVLIAVAQTAWAERGLMKALKERAEDLRKLGMAAPQLSYLQTQALRPAYTDDTDDYMELVISLGFVTMFSTVFPFMTFLVLISNLFELRVLAFRMCHVLRRPLPRIQDGIGAWLNIMTALTYLSCICSVGLVVFTLKPLAEDDRSTRIRNFVVAEHVFLALVYLFSMTFQDRNVADEAAEEMNAHVGDVITQAGQEKVQAKLGTRVCLAPGFEGLAPGIPSPDKAAPKAASSSAVKPE